MQDNQPQPAAVAGNKDEINSEGETVKSKDMIKQSGLAKNLALSNEGVALKWRSLTLLIMISFCRPWN